MLKARKISIMMIVTFVLMLVATFGMQLKTEAVFTDDFDVKWTNGTSGNGGSATINSSKNMDESFSRIIDKYKTVITFLSAIGAVTMVAVFILNFMKLGTTSGNPQERTKCIMALIVSGLAAAGLGSVALIVGIFYGVLGD